MRILPTASRDEAKTSVVADLAATFGPIVQEIIALIEKGFDNLPDILAALEAAGIITTPPPAWLTLLVTVLLALFPAANA